MLKWLESRTLWGCLFILGGALFLLDNLGLITFAGIFWSLLLLIGAIFFLSIFLANRLNWWAFIPVVIMISVAAVIALGYIFPDFANTWGIVIILGGTGVSFLVTFLLNRQCWWLVIPTGVFLTLAMITALGNFDVSNNYGGILLIGLGITFVLVAVLPVDKGKQTWAWIPGCILLVGGLFVTTFGNPFLGQIVLPITLISGGILLIVLTIRARRLI